ncbi:MAG: 4-alpha-glucanotransferase, partial [Actinobacteria bacterium]|nr:4-alpha-glucanotransferase [Actinomycetota bacterium]
MSGSQLARLAEHRGIAATYRDADDRVRRPPDRTLRALLTAVDVPCADADEIAASLHDAELEPWRRVVPATVTVRAGSSVSVDVYVEAEGAEASVRLGSGSAPVRELVVSLGDELRVVDGRERMRGSVLLPDDLEVGMHWLEVGGARAHVLVAPQRCPLPQRRGWGWQVQLYAMRTLHSWGIGDFADLSVLVRDAGRRGADFVLLNPLHAALPVVPQADSPYSPTSRRAWNPLYLRPERCDGWGSARGAGRTVLEECQAAGHALDATPQLDRDAVFAAKDRALRVLSAVPLPADRQDAFEAFVAAGGEALEDLVTALALASRHGGGVSAWPHGLREREPAALAAARAELAGELHHQRWLQWQCSEQLAAAQADADAAGMGVGLLTDLPVGVDGDGADAWAQRDVLALDVHVGAPPDAFAQHGQDWGLPPPRPDRLAATGYAPLRELVRANLRHAGGLRIDHVMGLFRLFWIPAGAPASEGTYVRYDAEAMLGAVVLEAHRAGAIVVGEDLGTVEEGVREALAERGILGSAVF